MGTTNFSKDFRRKYFSRLPRQAKERRLLILYGSIRRLNRQRPLLPAVELYLNHQHLFCLAAHSLCARLSSFAEEEATPNETTIPPDRPEVEWPKNSCSPPVVILEKTAEALATFD